MFAVQIVVLSAPHHAAALLGVEQQHHAAPSSAPSSSPALSLAVQHLGQSSHQPCVALHLNPNQHQHLGEGLFSYRLRALKGRCKGAAPIDLADKWVDDTEVEGAMRGQIWTDQRAGQSPAI